MQNAVPRPLLHFQGRPFISRSLARFKKFPGEDDDHFRVLCRYVERNPLRAGLVARAGLGYTLRQYPPSQGFSYS